MTSVGNEDNVPKVPHCHVRLAAASVTACPSRVTCHNCGAENPDPDLSVTLRTHPHSSVSSVVIVASFTAIIQLPIHRQPQYHHHHHRRQCHHCPRWHLVTDQSIGAPVSCGQSPRDGQSLVELQTNAREDFTITYKAHTK